MRQPVLHMMKMLYGLLGVSACLWAQAADFAYLTNQGEHTVSVIDMQQQAVIRTIMLPIAPVGLTVNQRGDRLYVADWYHDHVLVVAAESGRVMAQIHVGHAPGGLQLGRDDTILYVANRDSNDVSVIDIRVHKERTRIAVGAQPRAFGQFVGNESR